MSPYVYFESSRSSVPFLAVFASKWLVTRMDKLVSFQMALSDELFFALLVQANKWSFASLQIKLINILT